MISYAHCRAEAPFLFEARGFFRGRFASFPETYMSHEIRTIYKHEFPETLRNAKPCPPELYIRGELPDQSVFRFLCVVGSRKASSYGAQACRQIIQGLKGYPIAIVSGLAIGIDSLAHKAALEAGLPCVGFPGSGLGWDVLYPQSSRKLAEDILSSGGALLSMNDERATPEWWMFPQRNQLMAGISHATLVVEAGRRSGSLLTAEYATSNSRDVLAVPGSIYAAHSYGPHVLMKGCANPVTSSEDILKLFNFDIKERHARAAVHLPASAKRVLAFISLGETTNDLIADALHTPIREISAQISLLEIAGLVSVSGETVRIC